MKDLTISFSGYNIKGFLELAIMSFLRHHPDLRENIVVFDDESTDGTKEMLERIGVRRTSWMNEEYINSPIRRKNITVRVNMITTELIEQCQTKYLLNFDGDLYFRKNIVNEMLLMAERGKYDGIFALDHSNTDGFSINPIIVKYASNYTWEGKGMKKYWNGFLFMDVQKFISHGIKYDRLDNKVYNDYLNICIDSGVDFWDMVHNSSLKFTEFDRLLFLREYAVHFQGRSVRERMGFGYDNYHSNAPLTNDDINFIGKYVPEYV